MISQLTRIPEASKIPMGHVVVYHLSPDNFAAECQGIFLLGLFQREWDHDNEMSNADPYSRFIGLVHEHGACLVSLDREPLI